MLMAEPKCTNGRHDFSRRYSYKKGGNRNSERFEQVLFKVDC